MSWHVANECAERRFGSAARKQIIMFLADKASDDGSGIWCSKGTIQRHTELGESTVKQTINNFLKEGILIEIGRRRCKNGYTVIYSIVLLQIAQLESTTEPDIEAGSMVDPEPRPQRTPNHPKTIHKPPTRKRATAEVSDAEKILAAYPPDRLRGKPVCFAQIEEAMKEGIDPKNFLQAVQSYANDSEGLTRSKVCFSDNWFQSRRWQPYIERQQYCATRADYNRNRYPSLSATESELVRESDLGGQALADDLALADHGANLGGDRLDDGRELVLGLDDDAFGDGGAWADAEK